MIDAGGLRFDDAGKFDKWNNKMEDLIPLIHRRIQRRGRELNTVPTLSNLFGVSTSWELSFPPSSKLPQTWEFQLPPFVAGS
ncbi:hypothetical protein K1719_002907 [Acacia pycnantha]|nr:hypothetical protein K1719_002907 [Acacia pycnantha]